MRSELLIWIVGNLVMPAIPVISVYFAQLIADARPTVESVLEDGILFFYAVTAAAILIMDLWRDRIGSSSVVPIGLSTAYISVALVVLIFASGAYFVTALAHTGRLDHEGRPFSKKILAHLSWQFATAMTILSLGARVWSGLY